VEEEGGWRRRKEEEGGGRRRKEEEGGAYSAFRLCILDDFRVYIRLTTKLREGGGRKRFKRIESRPIKSLGHNSEQ
jgi:hypothetical protein